MYPFFEFLGSQSVWGKIFEKKSRAKFTVPTMCKTYESKIWGRKTYGSKITTIQKHDFFWSPKLKKRRSKNRFFFENILHPSNATVKQSKVTQ